VRAAKLTFDLMLELTSTGDASHNRPRFAACDAFLLG
jgi:hypothetical protein